VGTAAEAKVPCPEHTAVAAVDTLAHFPVYTADLLVVIAVTAGGTAAVTAAAVTAEVTAAVTAVEGPAR
jgi:hypothetical protein